MRDGIEPLNVHGLRVNYQTPRLPADEVRKIRAAVHNVVKMAKSITTEHQYLIGPCMIGVWGVQTSWRVSVITNIRFSKQLLDILPLPSRLDVKN